MIDSMHIIGSRQFGGADRFYVRLVEALNQAGHKASAVTRPETAIARALAPTVEQFPVAMRNRWDFVSAWRIRHLIRERHPTIVQTYMGRATRLTRVPPGSGAVHVARLGGYYKLDGYYRHAHAWVGNTRGVCDYLVRQGIPADSIYLIGNFVEGPEAVSDQDIDALRRTLDIPAHARVLMTAGRFISIKGFDDLLTAFSRLPAEVDGRPVFLVIIGDGPLRDSLRRQCREELLEERVRWPGWQNRLSPYYRLADAFVCPSRHETLGNVILEAWSHRVPVVATRTPGATELIQDPVNGLLSRCADPSALAERISELLRAPPDARDAMIGAGARSLAERHSRQAVLEGYMAMYAKLAGR
jgi:glycosyltransferase involved in cell wall biosynthesis